MSTTGTLLKRNSYKKEYVQIEWPEYQFFMDCPDVHYCSNSDTYFIPKDLYEEYLIFEDWLEYKRTKYDNIYGNCN